MSEVGKPSDAELARADGGACRIAHRLRAALRAAELGTKARKGSAVDALVVASAEPASTVPTSDGDDLRALAANAIGVAVEVI